VTSRNQAHALKKRLGRMPCASSFILCWVQGKASHPVMGARKHSKVGVSDGSRAGRVRLQGFLRSSRWLWNRDVNGPRFEARTLSGPDIHFCSPM